MARLHALCFTSPRPWSADEFTSILADRFTICETVDGGFALARVVADEAELLTIAVDLEKRRNGIARHILSRLLTTMKTRSAHFCFLEVAANNDPALALYAAMGFTESGRRPGYYHDRNGEKLDAVILSKPL